jgi:DNA-binding NarL/FixJ family response regulator
MFLLVFSINLIDQLSKGQSLIERWDKTIPFLIMAAFCFMATRKYKLNAYLYAFISIISLISTREEGNLTGVVFIIFTLYIVKSKWLSILISALTIVIIGTKVFYGFSGNQMIVLILGYVYSIGIYYILIHPKSDNRNKVICPNLDSQTVEILQKLYSGINIKQISYDIFLSEDAVSKRIQRARVAMGAKSREHLLAICREKGFIGLNMDNPTYK